MNKKLIVIGLALLIFTIIYLLLRPKAVPIVISPSPTPTTTPSATIQPTSVVVPTESVFQTPNDQLYGQAIKTLVQQYPWYPKLPIETKDFRIIYDFDKKSFRIRILTQPTDVIKQVAIDKLKEIGVDLTKFTYYFIEP